MKHVVITGVSSGMGRATARELAAAGYHVFGSVRRSSDGADVAKEIGERFTPLEFDVTDEQAVRAAADQVAAHLRKAPKGSSPYLAGLVNNAGMSEAGPLMHMPLDEFRNQIEINLTGQLAVTQAFLPLLGAETAQRGEPGRIVNVSSVGGRIATPFIGAYAASKHALEGMSDALRRELMIYGIDVIVIEPAAVKTAIWDKAERIDISPYEKTDYVELLQSFSRFFIDLGRKGWPPEKIARTIREALESPKPKTRYPIPNQRVLGWILPRMLPDRLLDRLIASRIGLKRRASVEPS